jgi:RNA polymerase sigma-70 factor (ECF subfamily)
MGIDGVLAGAFPGGVHSFGCIAGKITGNATMADSECAAEDAADIRAALSGDDEAYRRIVRRYQPLVFRQMFRFTRDRVILDELVQDVFVEAYFSLKGYRATAPFLHWLRRIATRVGYRHWKRSARQNRIAAAAREAASTEPGVARDPSDAGALVFEYLKRLSPPDRLVLTLLYLEQCENDEIAERTGWSRTLVRVRAHRARNRLKRILEEEGIEL